MGVDKATLPTPSGPLAAIPAAALKGAGCAPVILVGGHARSSGPALGAQVGLEWMPDREPGSGPLGGVATAVAEHPGRALAVCACDLPHLSTADLVPLLRAVLRDGADIAVFDLQGRPQWSIIALSAVGAAALSDAFSTGERSLHGAIEGATATTTGLVVTHLEPPNPDRIGDVDRIEDLPVTWRPPAGGVGTTPGSG